MSQTQVITSGSGPYYATPSWDQKITTGRFVVLTNWNNEAVLDRETGLVWGNSPSTGVFGNNPVNWRDAGLICAQRKVAGRMGWRLPTFNELTSLIDPSMAFPGPTLPVGHPFTNVSSIYWSGQLALGTALGRAQARALSTSSGS